MESYCTYLYLPVLTWPSFVIVSGVVRLGSEKLGRDHPVDVLGHRLVVRYVEGVELWILGVSGLPKPVVRRNLRNTPIGAGSAARFCMDVARGPRNQEA